MSKPKDPLGVKSDDELSLGFDDNIFERDLIDYLDENFGSSARISYFIENNIYYESSERNGNFLKNKSIFSAAKSIAAWNAKWNKIEALKNTKISESENNKEFPTVKLPPEITKISAKKNPVKNKETIKPHRTKITLKSIREK
jgi:hypothetical protein